MWWKNHNNVVFLPPTPQGHFISSFVWVSPRLSCSARTFWICVHLVSAGVCIWTQVSAMPHTHHCVPLPIPLGPCSMSWGVAMICVCAYGVCLTASGTCRLQCHYCICLKLDCVPRYHTHCKCCGPSHALERSFFPATPVAIKLAGHPRFPFLWVLTYLGIYTVNYGYVNIKWHFSRIISRCQRCFDLCMVHVSISKKFQNLYSDTNYLYGKLMFFNQENDKGIRQKINTFLSNLVTLWRGTF